jgi:hypothetical protein
MIQSWKVVFFRGTPPHGREALGSGREVKVLGEGQEAPGRLSEEGRSL